MALMCEDFMPNKKRSRLKDIAEEQAPPIAIGHVTLRVSDVGLAELFAGGPDLLMAASFSPPHRVIEVPGGYRFTGRGPLASTIHDSPWVMMTALVMDGAAPRMTPFGFSTWIS